MDLVSRAVTPHAEKALGTSIVMQNMTGGVGATALKHALKQPADGYTLLMGAENRQLYKVMGLTTEDYSDFEPIVLLARGVPVIVTRPDALFDTLRDGGVYRGEPEQDEVRLDRTGRAVFGRHGHADLRGGAAGRGGSL